MINFKRVIRVTLIVMSIALPVVFTHQSAVFLDRAIRDMRRGQNGLSKGLALLMLGIILGASVSTVDGTVRVIQHQDMPIYIIVTRAIAYSFMVPAMHRINNEVNKHDD